MSLFFANSLQFSRGRVLCSAWSMSQAVPPLLAVSLEGAGVGVYTEEGLPVGDAELAVVAARGASVTSLCWRPVPNHVQAQAGTSGEYPNVLALGWSDGTVSLWSRGVCKDDAQMHKAEIRDMAWSADGERLCVGDADGKVSVFKADQQLRPASVGFANEANVAVERVAAAPRAPSGAARFYAACNVGGLGSRVRVIEVEENGAKLPAFETEGKVAVLLAYAARGDAAVLITTQSMLHVHARDASVAPTAAWPAVVAGVKLPTGGDASPLGEGSACFVGPHMLATGSKREVLVFVSDLLNEDNFVLRPEVGAGGGQGSEGGITRLAFDATTGTLAASTRKHRVRLWSYRSPPAGSSANVEPSDSWVEMPAASIDNETIGGGGGGVAKSALSTVEHLCLAPGSRLIGCSTGDGISFHILTKCVLQRAAKHGISAVQVAPSVIEFEPLRGPAAVEGGDDEGNALRAHAPGMFASRTGDGVRQIHPDLQASGMDVGKTNLILWSSMRCQVFDISGNTVSNIGGFPLQRVGNNVPSLAVHGDTVFVPAGSVVEARNVQGTVRQTLHDAAGGGPVACVDVHNDILAVAGVDGRVRLWRLGGREAKPLKAGRVYDGDYGDGGAFGETTQLRVSSDGKRCALLCRIPSGSPSSCALCEHAVYVYDSETDTWARHMFQAKNLKPTGRMCWDAENPNLFAVEVEPVDERTKDGTSSGVDELDDGGGATNVDNTGADILGTLAKGADNPMMGANDPSMAGDVSDILLNGMGASQINMGVSGEGGDGGGAGGGSEAGGAEVCVLWSCGNGKIVEQELESAKRLGFVGLYAPNLLFHNAADVGNATSSAALPNRFSKAGRVQYATMRCFGGMEVTDVHTKAVLLQFALGLARDDMESVYRQVKNVSDPKTWQAMAHLCIRSRKLDAAEMCLGNMGHVAGARAAREAKSEREEEARVGIVAMQLGLYRDAAELFLSCKRYDLLSQLHRCRNDWDAALRVANKLDRVNLKRVHYEYAKHLEGLGDLEAAIQHFESSGTSGTEVPRMLYSHGELSKLERYCTNASEVARKELRTGKSQLASGKLSSAQEVFRWWVKFSEANGTPVAVDGMSGDVLSQVRSLLAQGNTAAATKLCDQSNDSAACFYVARAYEAEDNAKEAIRLYTKSGRPSHAVRLARRHGMDAELLGLAVQGDEQSMLDAAEYFESQNQLSRAAHLYRKSGRVSRALEMCFRHQLYDELNDIASHEQFDDARLLSRCADFFYENGEFGKTANMLARAGQYQRALDLCVQHGVMIDENIAEAMSPPRDGPNAMNDEDRKSLISRVAKICKDQGSFQLAAKKYTQAGDKVKALKALMRGGDAEKVMFFANVSRQRDVYVMAANYLQTLDWHSNADILKNIVTFYTKAKAPDSLSMFYESCAHVEIDDYRDYAKALAALEEAQKCLSKSRGTDEKEGRIAVLRRKCEDVEAFIAARAASTVNPDECKRLCERLLTSAANSVEGESALRMGDVFALLVEHYHGIGRMAEAQSTVDRMLASRIILAPYLDLGMVANIYESQGLNPPPEVRGGGGGGPVGDDDEPAAPFEEEDVVDDI
ncbi:IFT140 protein [Pseudoscourfieldia marina]